MTIDRRTIERRTSVLRPNVLPNDHLVVDQNPHAGDFARRTPYFPQSGTPPSPQQTHIRVHLVLSKQLNSVCTTKCSAIKCLRLNVYYQISFSQSNFFVLWDGDRPPIWCALNEFAGSMTPKCPLALEHLGRFCSSNSLERWFAKCIKFFKVNS